MFAEIEVLLPRTGPVGHLFQRGGDIDNRMKTLIDGLRVPRGTNERNQSPVPHEGLFYCLLEDDALVTKLTVEADELRRQSEPDDALVVLGVTVRKSVITYDNLGI